MIESEISLVTGPSKPCLTVEREFVDSGVGRDPVQVAIVTLNTGLKGNTFSLAELRGLRDELQQLKLIEGEGIVLKISSGGNNLGAFGRDTEGKLDNGVAHKWCTEVAIGAFDALYALQNRAVALIDGYAVGDGLELALAAGRVIMARRDDGRDVIALPEGRMGFIPAVDGIYSVLARCAANHLEDACKFLLSGQPIRADEAARIGIIDQAAPQGDAMTIAKQMAAQMASGFLGPRTGSLVEVATMPDLSSVSRFSGILDVSDSALRRSITAMAGASRAEGRHTASEAFKQVLATDIWKQEASYELARLNLAGVCKNYDAKVVTRSELQGDVYYAVVRGGGLTFALDTRNMSGNAMQLSLKAVEAISAATGKPGGQYSGFFGHSPPEGLR